MRFVDFLVSWNPGERRVRTRSGVDRPLAFEVDAPFSKLAVYCGSEAEELCHFTRSEEGFLWRFGERSSRGSTKDPQEVGVPQSQALPGPDLSGHFLLLAYRPLEQEWHVWTDRLGTMHAYYASNGFAAALGTFFPAVADAGSGKELNWEALTGYFGFGFFTCEGTFFKDIRILPPASHLIFDRDGRQIHEERYWNWWYEPNEGRSYSETLDEFDAVLSSVANDMVGSGPTAIPVSGGLDSRCLVAVLRRHPENRERLRALSYGYADDSPETSIAEEVARAADLSFERFTIGPYLLDHLDTVLDCGEGFHDVTQGRQAFVAETLADHDGVIVGHWGDSWLDAAALSEQLDEISLVEKAMEKCRKPGGEWLVENLCRPRLEGASAQNLLEIQVKEGLARLRHIKDRGFRLKAFMTDQWSFRWTLAGVRMYRAGTVPRLPFYDDRLCDFFCTVPGKFLEGRRFQIDYLKRFAPDLARIKWQRFDANLYRYRYFKTLQLPRRVVKKIGRGISGRRVPARNWEVQFSGESNRRKLEARLLESDRLQEFLEPGRIGELIDEVYRTPKAGNGYALSMLLTFSAWLERFG